MKLEAEYRRWLSMTFRGQQLGRVQIDAMRDAFFAGALAGHPMDAAEVFDEVKRHIESIQPERN